VTSAMQHLARRDRVALLRALSAAVAADFDAHIASQSRVDESAIQAALVAFRKHLGLKPEDRSEKARARLLSAFNEAIIDATLESADVEEVRQRVGQRGLLPPARYDIQFEPRFGEASGEYFRDTSIVSRAVAQADSVDHLTPPSDHRTSTTFSLFFKQINASHLPNAYGLLVSAGRHGATLTIVSAWRVFYDEVAVAPRTPPLSVLSAFLDRFGLDVLMNGDRVRMVRYARMPVDRSSGDSTLAVVAGPSPANKILAEGVTRTLPGGREQESAMAYVVNLDLYEASLRRHGIRW